MNRTKLLIALCLMSVGTVCYANDDDDAFVERVVSYVKAALDGKVSIGPNDEVQFPSLSNPSELHSTSPSEQARILASLVRDLEIHRKALAGE